MKKKQDYGFYTKKDLLEQLSKRDKKLSPSVNDALLFIPFYLMAALLIAYISKNLPIKSTT